MPQASLGHSANVPQTRHHLQSWEGIGTPLSASSHSSSCSNTGHWEDMGRAALPALPRCASPPLTALVSHPLGTGRQPGTLLKKQQHALLVSV